MKKTLSLALASLVGINAALAGTPGDSLTIDEVVVTGTRTPTDERYLPLTVTTISRQQIDRSFSTSLLPVVNEQVPGLFITDRGVMGYGVSTGAAGAITIRGIGGSPTTQVMVLVDGAPHYTGLMGHTVADLYQSLIAEKVEVVRGPASAIYGSNAMGGVMNIITRKSPRQAYNEKKELLTRNKIRLEGGSYGTVSGEYFGEQSYGRFGNIIGVEAGATDGHRKNMHFEQYSFIDKMEYRIGRHWTAGANVTMTHFISNNPGTTDEPMYDNRMNIHRGILTAGMRNSYGNMNGAIQYYLDWGNHKIDDGHTADAAEKTFFFRLRDHIQGVNIYETFRLFKHNATTFGFDYQHIEGKAWNEAKEDGADVSQPKGYDTWHHADEVAGYIDFRQTVAELLTFDAAVRYNHHSVSGGEWVPQAGVSYSPLADGVLKASVMKGFRNPTLREMYVYPPSNDSLRAEELMNYELSWSHAFKAFRYGVNIFYIDADNIIQTVNRHNINTGKLYNWGIEAEAAYRLNSRLSLNANYSYLHTSKEVVAAPRNKLFVGGEYSKDRFRLSTGAQWIGHLITAVGTDEAKASTEDFILWNMRASYKATSFLTLFAKGENLLCERYEINEGFPMPKATVMAGADIIF